MSRRTTALLVGAAMAALMLALAGAASSHLVINEVDYDQPGSDTTEFMEIYNPTENTISLSGLAAVMSHWPAHSEFRARRVTTFAILRLRTPGAAARRPRRRRGPGPWRIRPARCARSG